MMNRLLGCLAMNSLAVAGMAQQGGQTDFMSADLEDLMKIKVTTSSRVPTSMFKTPASIAVVTNEDIIRSGARTIPDALRLIPGVQVAQVSSHLWAISIRHFNSQYPNKLLVLVDGRSVYSPLYSGVYWDTQSFPMSDIERIEVVRGPGGTLWGSNAVNGVINIITKSAHDTLENTVQAGTGSLTALDLTAETGFKGEQQSDWRIYSRAIQDKSYLDNNGKYAGDTGQSAIVGFRADGTRNNNNWTLSGQALWGSYNTLASSSKGPDPLLQTQSPFSAWVNGRIEQTQSATVNSTMQFSYASSRSDAIEVETATESFDSDYQRRQVTAKHELVYGVGYRKSNTGTRAGQFASLTPPNKTLELISLFFQDDFKLDSRSNVAFGTKLERNSYTGWEFQPSIRYLHQITEQANVWAAATRAVRTPSRVDNDIQAAYGVTMTGYGPTMLVLMPSETVAERMVSFEAGYRNLVNERTTFEISAFENIYDQLLVTTFGTLLPPNSMGPLAAQLVNYSNAGSAHTYGLETSLRWQPNRRLSTRVGIAIYTANSNTDNLTRVDPLQQLSGQLQYELRAGEILTASLYYQNAKASENYNAASLVPEHVTPYRFDLNYSRKLNPNSEITITGQNLLAPSGYESYIQQTAIAMHIPRSIYAGIRLRF